MSHPYQYYSQQRLLIYRCLSRPLQKRNSSTLANKSIVPNHPRFRLMDSTRWRWTTWNELGPLPRLAPVIGQSFHNCLRWTAPFYGDIKFTFNIVVLLRLCNKATARVLTLNGLQISNRLFTKISWVVCSALSSSSSTNLHIRYHQPADTGW